MRPVMTFQGMWPITDTTRPLADLAAEGLADVPQLATDAGAVLIGPPVWRRITGPDGGPWLECRAPAWRARSHRAHVEAANDAAVRGQSLVEGVSVCVRDGCSLVAGRSGLCVTHRRQAGKARRAAAEAVAA